MFSRSFPRIIQRGMPRASTIYQCQNPLYFPTALRVARPSTIARHRQASTRAAAKRLFKENPFTFSLACILIVCGIGSLAYTNYVYKTMVETFHNFPEPVANKIRRALYYSNIELDPKRAINYYKQALDLANDLGMDPFSAEIIGTKLQLAAFMEKIHQYEKAIQVLEIIRVDCLKWIGDGGSKPGREADRNRVLNKVVAISLRLGELYSNKHVKEDEEAERNLVLAVETMLKETKRREDEGIKEGEGQWMTNEEMGATLESLADYYSTKSQHYLSTPLYIQALSLLLPPSNSSPQTTPPTPIPSCHTITLMSNLSTSLLLQSPPSSFSPSTPSPSKAQQISSAQAWAQQAVETAKEIRGRGVRGEEGEECDRGCAVAMVNLGEMAILEGDSEGARRWFGEGKRVAKAVGWMEGVERAREGEGRVGGGNG